MAINFPTSLDTITNPTATDYLNSPSHAGQHADANDAIEALEAKLGINSSAVTTSHDYKLSGVTGTDKAASLTGTETLTNKTLGETILGEVMIKLDNVLSEDEKCSGFGVDGVAGAQLVYGEVCYLASSGKWLKVDGILDGTDTGFDKKLGICVLAAAGDTAATKILKYGKVRSAKFPALTIGSAVYLSDTAGELVVAQPSTTNFAIRKVGEAITAEDLFFNPSEELMVHI